MIRRFGDRLRIIVVQLEQMDSLIQRSITEHLDGIFSLMPSWTMELGKAVDAGDLSRAAEYRSRIVHFRDLLRRFGSFQAATVLLNSQGIPGYFAPAPMRPLSEAQCEDLLEDSIVKLGPC
ncbi:MAG: hypothetical protein JXM70_20495 [Pirellulales bacterium]|nr:hypothetical protein [Pirellulales bacterium]